MIKVLRHIPNALTCANLLCGCIAIIGMAERQIDPIGAAYFLWLACIFDFLDGFAARALKVSSPIGKELDSLADMVTFGVLPGFVMFKMIRTADDLAYSVSFIALMIVVFSALRLAKFNVDENQKESFIGVPTPAAALFVTGLPFLPAPLDILLINGPTLIAITVIISLLMVAPFELIALKFKNFSWAENKARFIFMALALLLLISWQAGAISLIILLYIAISLVTRAFSRK